MTDFVAKQLASWRWRLYTVAQVLRPPDDPPDYERPAERWWHFFSRHDMPLAGIVDWKRLYARFCLYLGLNLETREPVFSQPETAVLVIGPSGSAKSSGLMIQNVLTAVWSTVVISPRLDLFRNTARWRAQYGRVLHFSPTGKVLPGATPVRFDPTVSCEDEIEADKIALRWASWIPRDEYSQQGGGRTFEYFRQRCREVFFSLFHIAAVLRESGDADKHIGWVAAFVNSSEFAKQVKQLRTECSAFPGLQAHVDRLVKIALLSAEEQGNVLGTASNMLRAYQNSKVVAAATDPNVWLINFKAFVRGRPDTQLRVLGIDTTLLGDHGVWPFAIGSADTLYMTEVNAESPEAFPCMDIEFRVREAQYQHVDEREQAGLSRPPPVTVVSDEGYMAPPVRIGQVTAAERGRGVIFIMALQSLSQAELIWGRLGEDFLTLFPTTVVFPGIKDDKTLKLLSLLAGQYWQKMESQTAGIDGSGKVTTGSQVGWQLMPRLPEWIIAQGHPEIADAAIVLRPDASWDWIEVPPYYRGEPWPRLLVNAMEFTAGQELNLAGPQLAREGDFTYLDQLGLSDRFRAVLHQLNQH